MNRITFWWRYVRGKIPWDSGVVPPEVIRLADHLPAGRSLDLGCGTGTSSLYLAGRGWRAIGVDFVQIAIGHARRKAKQQHLAAEFHCADVTKLSFLEPPFNLILDVGCFHCLAPDQQRNYADHLARLAVPGATYALYAHQPRLIDGSRVGVTEDEVAQVFAPAFALTAVERGVDNAARGDRPPNASAWYYLRRQA